MTTGNLAKERILEELGRLFASEPETVFRVLDVGITGPQPLQFWQGIFGHDNFELTGVDIDTASIDALKAEDLPKQIVRLEAMSGYDIAARLGEDRFDAVVSTQVLEHMKYPERFIEAAYRTLAPGGRLLLCYDSGDYPRKTDRIKEFAKDVIVFLTGSERYHDKDIPTEEVQTMLEKTGFIVEDRRWYNIHPLKRIQNHEINDRHKKEIGELWKALEDRLNDIGHASAHPGRYLGAYFKARKPKP